MYQQLWGYKVEEKLYLGVREQKRLNTTALDNWYVIWGCLTLVRVDDSTVYTRSTLISESYAQVCGLRA
jgi:hypothetical protein